MKPKYQARILLPLCSVLWSASTHAADLYWDPNGDTAGTGGSGAWNTSGSFWRNGSDSGSLQAWAAGNVAILGGTAGTLTMGAATSTNGITVLAETVGNSYAVTTSTTNLLTLAADAALVSPAGKTLAFTGAGSGAVLGGSGTAQIQGGGTMTIGGSNRVFAGILRASGTGTTLIINGTNALDNGSASTGLAAVQGATVRINGTNNYRRTATLDGATLECAHIRSFQAQTNNILTINGSSGSMSIVANAKDGEIGGLAGNGQTTRVVTVNTTNDPGGIDLDYRAGWRNGTMNKAGAGTLRISNGAIFNRNDNYTTANSASSALNVTAGVVLNEGTIMSPAAVGVGGLLTHGTSTGIFDQVTINTGGVFQIGRIDGLFNDSFVHAAGQSDITFSGGTLRYAPGFQQDLSPRFSSIGTSGGAIDTNGNEVTLATPLGGTGSLAKKGAGSLILSGGHTISGLSVEEGVLRLAADSSLDGTTITLKSTGQLEAAAGASFGGVLTSDSRSVSEDVIGDFTLGSTGLLRPGGRDFEYDMIFSGDLTLDGTYEADVTEFGIDQVQVAGDLDVTRGSFRIHLATPSPTGGVLATYGGTLTGVPKLAGFLADSRYGAALVHNPAAKTISLTLAAGATPLALTWTGSDGGEWDLATSQKNFIRDAGGTPDAFRQLDALTFPNAATTTHVTITGELAPESLVFQHSDIDYTISGNGSIAGLTSLVKNGTGTLTLATDNSYSSGTFLNAGRIQVGTGGSTGSLGTGPVTNDGQLAFHRAANLTLPMAISGTGSLSFTGGALFTLAETNTYSGGTTVLGGILRQGKAGAIPTPASGSATITISGGGSLDLGGLALAGSAALPIVASGPGTSPGSGAIFNSGASLANSGISFLTLAGDTAIGGDGGRFDITGTGGAGGIRSIDPLTSHRLTKVGSNHIALKTDDYSGVSQVVVEGGILGVENDNLGSPTRPITVQSAGTVSFWGNRSLSSPFTLQGGIVRSDNGLTNSISGDMVLAANSTFAGAGSTALTLSGVISGAGRLLKDGASDLTITRDNDYTGGTTLTGSGRILVTADHALGTAGEVELAGIAESQLTLAAANMTFSRPLHIRSGGRVNQGAVFASQAGVTTLAGNVTVSGAHSAGGTFGSTTGAELILSGIVTQSVVGLDPLQPTLLTPVRIAVRNGTVRFDNPANNFRWLYLSENTIKIGADNALPTGAIFSLGDNTNGAFFDLNGYDQELRSLSRWGSSGGTTIRNTGASPSVLTFRTDFTDRAQIETALANGTATADGQVAVTLTGQGVTGSPLALSVPIAAGDTPELWAAKVRAALAATPEVTALFDVAGSGNQISLIRNAPAANDGTLNLALANGTENPGITAAANSGNAAAGVAPFYAGTITGDISLVKTGPETLTLSGTHSQTGTTTIEQGKLLLNATHSGGAAYSVQANATLGGSGSTSSAVNVAGTITGGDTTTLGTLSTGVLSFQSGATLAVNINTTDATADYILATGGASTSGTVNLSLTDANPAPLALGTTLQILGHGGSWDGLLSYNGSPVPDEGVIQAGPNHFRVKYQDSTPAVPALTLTAVAPSSGNFASWAAANNISGGAAGDSDHDGIPNLMEYALATRLDGPDGSPGSLQNGVLTFTKRSDALANGDLTYVIETSSTLMADSWTPAVTHGPGNAEATISHPLPQGQGRIFARLKVSENP